MATFSLCKKRDLWMSISCSTKWPEEYYFPIDSWHRTSFGQQLVVTPVWWHNQCKQALILHIYINSTPFWRERIEERERCWGHWRRERGKSGGRGEFVRWKWRRWIFKYGWLMMLFSRLFMWWKPLFLFPPSASSTSAVAVTFNLPPPSKGEKGGYKQFFSALDNRLQ